MDNNIKDTITENDTQSPAVDITAPEQIIDTGSFDAGEEETPVIEGVGTDFVCDDTKVPEERAEDEEVSETQAVTEQPDDYTPGAQNFVSNLPYMGKGMLAIFVVIAVIMGVTALLNKVFKK